MGLGVAYSRLINRLVARFVVGATALGWAALAALAVSVLFVGGATGHTIALLVAPFGGLAFWVAKGGGGGHRPEPQPPQDKPPPRRLAQPARKRPHSAAPRRVRVSPSGRGVEKSRNKEP